MKELRRIFFDLDLRSLLSLSFLVAREATMESLVLVVRSMSLIRSEVGERALEGDAETNNSKKWEERAHHGLSTVKIRRPTEWGENCSYLF